MAATATAVSVGPRYAPEDPTLPKPWRGLVDGKTGYLYFWNPETNVTQYERPVAAAPLNSSIVSISSSVQVQKPSSGHSYGNNLNESNDKYGRGSHGAPKHEVARGETFQSHDTLNGISSTGHGGTSLKGHRPSDAGSVLSADSYRQRHEITFSGDSVPPPFSSFEATGFPPEILREVRYLLLGGANVVRCGALFVWGLALIWSALLWWTNFWEGLSESPIFAAGTAVGDDSVPLSLYKRRGLLLLQLAISKHWPHAYGGCCFFWT